MPQPRRPVTNDAHVVRLYVEECWPYEMIARALDLTVWQVREALRGAGIKPRTPAQAARVRAASGTERHPIKHGCSQSTTYQVWVDMKKRCLNPTTRAYRYYGGRGITVCDRWRESIQNFLADMGERPVGMTLDRIDNNDNYQCGHGPAFGPGNCRWATMTEQAANRRGLFRTGARQARA